MQPIGGISESHVVANHPVQLPERPMLHAASTTTELRSTSKNYNIPLVCCYHTVDAGFSKWKALQVLSDSQNEDLVEASCHPEHGGAARNQALEGGGA